MPDAAKPQPRRATVRQLAHRIQGTGETPVPRFCVFLGAGASAESAIPTASHMIDDFCRRIIADQCPEDYTDPEQQQAWLEEQPWYIEAKEEGTLYSVLFERHEQNERGRQFYIEQMIEGKKPSFGYVVLANLIARNYINTVFTTNFDDLVYNACSIFTDIRPVVYAYGTMVADLRITNTRPKILKLHGDYLYSKLKNSNHELARQDPNMSRYVPNLLNEYGLVVIGYSGCDNSVMELLRKFPPDNDLYWCGPRAGPPMPESVRSLLIETGGFYVEIDGFDQMMNEIRSIIGFDVPKMLRSLEAREEQILDQLKSLPSHTVSRLISVFREICDFRQSAAARQQKWKKEEAFLHYVNALEAWQKTDFTRAEAEFRASLELNPEDINARISLAGVLCQQGHYKESEEEIDKARPNATGEVLVKVAFQLAYLYMVQGRQSDALAEFNEVIRLDPQNASAHNGAGVAYMVLKRFDDAASALRKAAELDPAIYYPAFNLASVLALKGDQAESQKWWLKASSVWQLLDNIDPYNHAIIEACLGHADKAIEEMRAAIQRGQPGLASLALESVLMIEAAPAFPPVIHTLRQMLELQAVPRESAPQVNPKVDSSAGAGPPP
jgi:Flp pilus assembly protein TadD/NAD-dependent SIR2 family protein deacetylase